MVRNIFAFVRLMPSNLCFTCDLINNAIFHNVIDVIAYFAGMEWLLVSVFFLFFLIVFFIDIFNECLEQRSD